jgi:hypothetical protein
MKKRNLTSVAWEDPLAWTESMRGPAWRQLIQREQNTYEAVLKKYVKPNEVQRISDELAVAGQAQLSEPFLVVNRVHIWDLGTLSILWKWITTATEHVAADCAADETGNIWDVVDTGDGAETYTLRYWPHEVEEPAWSLSGVGPYVIVIDDVCFFLEAQNSLWYNRFCCVDAKTGKGKRLLYEEKDPLWNLSLKRGENHTGYLIREDSGLQQAYFFHDNKTLRPLPVSGFFILGGGAPNDYLATEGRGTDAWRGYGPRLSRWILPNGHGIPESVWVEQGLLVTRRQGMRYVWHCTTRSQPRLLHDGISRIQMNEWGAFHQDRTAAFRVTEPGAFTSFCMIQKGSFACLPPHIPKYASHEREYAGKIPYILVKPNNGPVTSLLVTGYGAYGMPSSLDTTRWFPLLRRGWAVAIAMVRGGGDDTMGWADAARTWRREFAILDFEAVIRSAQRKTGVSAKHTVVYGRSAGGILIGASAARQKNTTLFAGLYGEVPYLDVLRTTTNPSLPLTQMEYNEFGNPAERLEDLIAIGRISPMEGIPPQGYPGLFTLIRTGSNDKEVFAYEPVKWVVKARGGAEKKDPNKLLAFEEKEGHFVGGADGRAHRAMDLAVLLAWRQFGSFRLA